MYDINGHPHTDYFTLFPLYTGPETMHLVQKLTDLCWYRGVKYLGYRQVFSIFEYHDYFENFRDIYNFVAAALLAIARKSSRLL